MKIYREIKTNLLRQKYGKENTIPSMLAFYQSLGILGHDGWDWGVVCIDSTLTHGGHCDPVYCGIDGFATITSIYKDDSIGWGINALDQDGIHKHCWWHFDTIDESLKVGSRIEGGDYLGIAGNTGHSTGAHLHRGLYEYGLEDNGYHGAIDLEPYFINIYIKDYIDTLNSQIGILQKIINLLKQIFGLK